MIRQAMKLWWNRFCNKKPTVPTGISLEILAQAITEYRVQGTELMQRLGQKYGLDITVKEQYEELISRRNPNVPRKGSVSQRVNYSFHGGECGFYNLKTQQHVEVILSNPPSFGKIEAWFLKQYLDSTETYKLFSKGIDWQDLKPMLQELYRTGRVEEIN
jgi:hypothetical protein